MCCLLLFILLIDQKIYLWRVRAVNLFAASSCGKNLIVASSCGTGFICGENLISRTHELCLLMLLPHTTYQPTHDHHATCQPPQPPQPTRIYIYIYVYLYTLYIYIIFHTHKERERERVSKEACGASSVGAI